MRVNLIAQNSAPQPPVIGSRPITLTIKPSRGYAGEYSFSTDSVAVLRMLKGKTDLRAAIIETFDEELRASKCARILGVEMSDSILTEIGYFV